MPMKVHVLRKTLVLSLLLISLTGCAIFKDSSTVGVTGNSFMTTFRDGDAKASWNMLTTEVQAEVGSQAKWEEYLTERNFSSWNFSDTQIENGVAQINGEATLGVDTYTVVLVLQKSENSWKISGVNFTFNP
jgi:hypothetical protein